MMIRLRDEFGLSAREVFDGLPAWEIDVLDSIAHRRQQQRAREQG